MKPENHVTVSLALVCLLTQRANIADQMENEIVTSKKVDKARVKKEKSIYKQFSIFRMFPHFLVDMAVNLNVRDMIIGSDKFGHFFEEGWRYFDLGGPGLLSARTEGLLRAGRAAAGSK